MPINTLAILTLLIILANPSCRKERILGPPRAVPVANTGTLNLRLMTFNIRYETTDDHGPRAWNHRIPHIVRMIREENPDVIGIQEALHGQAADLWASLPDFEFHGNARDDGHRTGEYTAILYRRDRFEAHPADHGTFWLSNTPETAGSTHWGNQIPRTATWLRLTDRASHRSFYAFNTHWDHQNQPSRVRAAELLASRIVHRGSPGDPIVLLGDFNARPHNPAITALAKQAALTETFQHLHPGLINHPTLHFWRGKSAGPYNVDHIFVSTPSDILAATIRHHDSPMLSDHFPVTAHVEFP
jgi:endonuclease/exonuclease/phosphatase family metal-dependent hydrolase